MKQASQYDCCIIGGGMVGAAMALGLAKQSYKVALIEKQALQEFAPSQAPDMRLSAFNMHSVNLLAKLGAWQHVLKMRYREYDSLAVWDAQSPMGSNFESATRFTATEVKQAKLGYFVENRLIQLALYDEINAHYPHRVDAVHGQDIKTLDTEHGVVEFANNERMQAKLIIGADGAHSMVRKAANIPTSGWQYSQQANAILIQTQTSLPNETWQAFYSSGPRALLPMYDNYACLIWYDNQQQSAWIQNANNIELAKALKANFPELKAQYKILQVAQFGLTRMHAIRYGCQKAIILGDAAHTINPLAGQGVNLGFKDVDALLELIADNGVFEPELLISAFENKRKNANLAMMTAMDAIYAGFSNSLLPAQIVRGIGLKLANKSGPIKRQAIKYAMGL